MTPLLTRMRPFASHAARIRLPHRADRGDTGHRAATAGLPTLPPLPAIEERLATEAEIDLLLASRARAL